MASLLRKAGLGSILRLMKFKWNFRWLLPLEISPCQYFSLSSYFLRKILANFSCLFLFSIEVSLRLHDFPFYIALHPFLDSFTQKIWSILCIPGIVLGTRDTNKQNTSWRFSCRELFTNFFLSSQIKASISDYKVISFSFLLITLYLLITFNVLILRCEAMKNRYLDVFLAFGVL